MPAPKDIDKYLLWKERISKSLLGIKNPNYGKPKSEETKKKISEANKGKSSPMKGKILSEKTKEKIRVSHIGKPLSTEHKNKISIANKGRIKSLEERINLSKALKNRKFTETHKKNMSLSRIGNKYALGQKRSEKTKKLMSLVSKNLWKNPEFVRKQMISRGVFPNKKELFLNEIINNILPNQYKYVGSGEFILGGKCPDFLNINGQKKIIELYGNYWHKNENINIRINYFKQFGYDTLIIWEHELKNIETLKNKLLKFNGGLS